MFVLRPGIFESCGQYEFESRIKRGTNLLFPFLPGAFLSLLRSPELKASYYYPTLQAEVVVVVLFSFYFPISRFKHVQALEGPSLNQGLSSLP